MYSGTCLFWFLTIFVLVGSYETRRRPSSSPKQKYQCPGPKLANGRVVLKSSGRLAIFRCYRGYQIVGDKYNYCGSLGKWDNVFPVCVKPGCRNISSVPGGVVYTELDGAILRIYCVPGNAISGYPVQYCDGTRWNGPAPVCQPTGKVPTVDCTFEEDMCGWSQDLDHDFDWQRTSAALLELSVTLLAGPNRDHTYGNGSGYYLHVAEKSQTPNDVSRVVSPIISSTRSDKCLSFWMHARGSGQLKIYVHRSSQSFDTSRLQRLLTIPGDLGDSWRLQMVTVPPVLERFQLVIEASSGPARDASISIDDITFKDDCQVIEPDEPDVETDSDVPIGTCEGRCDIASTEICSCVPQCVDFSNCCPDYLAFCESFIDSNTWSSTLDMYSTDYTTWTTWNTSDIAETTEMQSTEYEDTTSSTSRIRQPLQTVPDGDEKGTSSTTPTETMTSVTKKKWTFRPNTTSISTATPTSPSTTRKQTTKLTSKVPTTRQPMKTTFKSTTKASTTRKPTTKLTSKMPTTRQQTKTIPTTKMMSKLTTKLLTTSQPTKTTQKPTKPSATSHSSLAIAPKIASKITNSKEFLYGTIGAGVVLSLLLISGIIYMFKTRGKCKKLRSINSSDSCSDVRFLASDELLDFNLRTAESID